MIIFLSIICNNNYWPFVEKKVIEFESQLKACHLPAPVAQLYWKEPMLFEFREGLSTELSCGVIQEKIKILCKDFGEVMIQRTSQEIGYSIFSSIPEMLENEKSIFITISISGLVP